MQNNTLNNVNTKQRQHAQTAKKNCEGGASSSPHAQSRSLLDETRVMPKRDDSALGECFSKQVLWILLDCACINLLKQFASPCLTKLPSLLTPSYLDLNPTTYRRFWTGTRSSYLHHLTWALNSRHELLSVCKFQVSILNRTAAVPNPLRAASCRACRRKQTVCS